MGIEAIARPFSELGILARYSVELPKYLRRRLTSADAHSRLERAIHDRAANFLSILERGVFEQKESPYLRLFRWAGIEFADVQQLVHTHGLEAALGRLYDNGVFVTLDEVKGRKPIDRPGLHIPVCRTAFDNPLSARHYQGMSSGSRGPRTRVNIDLGMMEHEAAYVHHYLDAFDLWKRPYCAWRPVPPVVTGVKWILRLEALGKPLDRWFSQTKVDFKDGRWKFALFTALTVSEGRMCGRRFPSPEHVPSDAPEPIARYLVEMRQRGTPAVVDTMVSSAVRLCTYAQDRGLDISGTLFRLGGEPLTAAKVRIIESVGCRAICFYSITEISFVGAPCVSGSAPDDVHLLMDKLVALRRPKATPTGSVDALIYTTLLPSSPKLLINVESGDFADVEIRECGCALGRLGFNQHLSRIRSYEKLTGEGVTFLGTELLRLIDDVLPAAFGGSPTDYQLVETEDSGVTRVLVIASPTLGDLDETSVINCVLETLQACPGGHAMTSQWIQSGTLKLVRTLPYQTASAKVLPLFVDASSRAERP